MGMTEDMELAGLSEEEIEALKDDDEGLGDDPAGDVDDENAQATDSNAEEESAQNESQQTAEGDENAQDTAGDPEAAADEDPKPEADQQEDEDQKTEGQTQQPADTRTDSAFNLKTEGKAEEINTQLDELKQSFDDGEIDFEEFLSKRDDLRAQLLKAEMYEDINRQVREQAWEAAKEAFITHNPDIMGYSSRAAGYAAILQDLLQSEEGQKMADTEILEKAREKFYEENPQLAPGLTEPEKDSKKDDPKSRVKELKSGQKKQQQVRTLANLPSAEANDTGSSEFVHLDNLPPEKLEKALEKMSDAELERYLEAS